MPASAPTLLVLRRSTLRRSAFAALMRADLRQASLVNVYLMGANLTDASLEQATLTLADLRGAKGVTQAQLNEACGTEVKLDPPLTIKPCSPDQQR